MIRDLVFMTHTEQITTAQNRTSGDFVAANPAGRKEPPPKKPPVKAPNKPKKPVGDPPPTRSPKRVTPLRDS
jgi:hypothetical protein